MVEVKVNGQELENLPTSVKYTKQVNDLADISTLNTSFTYTLKTPKTPKNTRILQGLGLIGDTSRFPYRKNDTSLTDNGNTLISKGILRVKETDENYNLFIQDGIVDFVKLIENKTLGKDLDLSELEHEKTVAEIVASWSNDTYRYIISDYNGRMISAANTIDPNYQIPSVNLQWLFDKVMDYTGFTYEGLPDLSGYWVTFPQPPLIEDEELVQRFFASSQVYNPIGVPTNFAFPAFFAQLNWNTPIEINSVELVNNWIIRLQQTANWKFYYSISATIDIRITAGSVSVNVPNIPLKAMLWKNGEIVGEPVFHNQATKIFNFSGSIGDEIGIVVDYPTQQDLLDLEFDFSDLPSIFVQRVLDAIEDRDFILTAVNFNGVIADLYTSGVETFSFQQAFNDFGIVDFFKEIMFRESLTPFVDNNEKKITFKPLSERLDVSQAIDISKYYIARERESYEFGKYARRNGFLMKQDNSDETYGNGYFDVNNENLKEFESIFQSKFYAPLPNLTQYFQNLPGDTGEFFPVLKLWEKEVKQEEEEMITEYKPLSNRFFLIKQNIVDRNINIGTEPVTSFPKANVSGTLLSDVIGEKYTTIGSILNDTRVHDILLSLNSHTFETMPMDKPVYIEQEGQFYLLNRLIYETGKNVMGEFLRIKPQPNVNRQAR